MQVLDGSKRQAERAALTLPKKHVKGVCYVDDGGRYCLLSRPSDLRYGMHKDMSLWLLATPFLASIHSVPASSAANQ
ncbi:hypothetical protein NMY22_g14581 [Coprinellus aureogranulatus]|nr:hypothetical protein NMY22_g14581 [Coprinellus aureogranulatus]